MDIAETIELKKQALLAHPSQLDEGIADFVVQMSRGQAKDQPFELAESFRRIIFDRPPEELAPQD